MSSSPNLQVHPAKGRSAQRSRLQAQAGESVAVQLSKRQVVKFLEQPLAGADSAAGSSQRHASWRPLLKLFHNLLVRNVTPRIIITVGNKPPLPPIICNPLLEHGKVITKGLCVPHEIYTPVSTRI